MATDTQRSNRPRLAAVQVDRPAPLATTADLIDSLRLSRAKAEQLVRAGLPCYDVSSHREGKRRKRALRFDLLEVRAWLRARGRA